VSIVDRDAAEEAALRLKLKQLSDTLSAAKVESKTNADTLQRDIFAVKKGYEGTERWT
jgi:hypothetical protein